MISEGIQEILRTRGDGEDSILVLVVPPTSLGELLGQTRVPEEACYTPDLSISKYRSRFEPELSESRIRELCAGGHFPDYEDESGEKTPGAYKNSKGEWRITMEGIIARQKSERAKGIQRRENERRRADARKEIPEKPGEPSDPLRVPPPRSSMIPKEDRSESTLASRPRKGAWQGILEEKRAG